MAISGDDAPHITGTVIVLVVIGYLTFALRVFTRVTKAVWGREDWVMTAALVPFTALSVACLGASFNGVGIHASRLEEEGNQGYITLGMFWFFLFEVLYCFTIIPVKLSISLMLIRIAESRRGYVYAQYIIIAMFTVMNLIAALYIIFQCNPVAAAWDQSLLQHGGECKPAVYLENIYYATTAVNIFTDWATALMPIGLLKSVQMNRNSKVTVGILLGLGIFASLSACIRLKYTVNLTSSNDYLFGLANIVIWGYAENGIGLIVGNTATLRPLFRRVLRLGSDAEDSRRGGGVEAGGFGGGTGGTGSSGTGSSSNRSDGWRAGLKDYHASYELRQNGTTSDSIGTYSASAGGTPGTPGVPRRKMSRKGDERSSVADGESDSESQRQILEEPAPVEPGAIRVSRAVSISRD